MDYSRSGGASTGGDDHHKHTVLETLPHGQAGVPARHHEHCPTEAEGKREKSTLIMFTHVVWSNRKITQTEKHPLHC